MEQLVSRTASHRGSVALMQAHRAAAKAMFDLLSEIGRLDDHEARMEVAAGDMAEWLVCDLGIARKTAAAWVRIARRLPDLPLSASAYREGAISFDELTVLCHYATRETEASLLESTRELTPQELARACRQARVTEQKQALEDRNERYIRTWWSEDDRFLNIAGQIPGVDGVTVEKALRRLTVKAPRDPHDDQPVDPQTAHADALVQMASQSIAADGDADLATVVIHADATALAGATGALTTGGIALDLTGVLRAACDARLQLLVESADGSPLGVGRTRRTVPAWLRRILRKRDRHCRFPGCQRSHWVHMHHIQHWAHGGPTDVDNLVMLCGFHHRVVHDDGWTIQGDPNGVLRFIDRFGLPHRPIRERWFPDHWVERLLESVDSAAEHQLAAVAARAGAR